VHPCTAMYPIALNLTSLPRWALTLLCVPWPQTSPSCRGWLQRCHVFRGPRPRLLAEVSSSAAMCSSALDLTSLPKWTSALPRVPCLRTLPP
jgi:hypothetical protein